jgi:predicted nucleic acid-binding protein
VVVVDASVWIDVLNKRQTPQISALQRLAAEDTLAVADLTLFEVLQGVKPVTRFEKVRSYLMAFVALSTCGSELAIKAAENSLALQLFGVTAATVDCLLATYCIQHDLRFLTSDRDFEPFAVHLGLRLVT